MIDTHCHLDVEAFDRDRDQVVARATAAGVRGFLVPAIRPRTWPALIALAARHGSAGMRCALGIHPQIVPALAADELGRALTQDLAEQIARAVTEAGAIAVGECGLDGGTGELPRQELIFRAHLRAARMLGLPAVIHVLRAHDRAPQILREEGPLTGVLHSYSGGAALVPVYQELGLAFSFAGPISYPNARRPVEAARLIPADLLLVETDAPDQAPEGHRGGRSEPALLPAVLAGLAAARGEDPAALAALTARNARRIFASW
ncbi:MAG: TatD family hydrolase [Myxococcales bacterium]|nr:TatD family hydrolase [Myxococcales bacterium]